MARKCFSFKPLFIQILNTAVKQLQKHKMHFSIYCFPADLLSPGFFLRLFPRVVFWEAFFLGVCKLLVLINFLIISSLSFTFCVRGNFSFFILLFFGRVGGNFPGIIFWGRAIFWRAIFPEAIFRTPLKITFVLYIVESLS